MKLGIPRLGIYSSAIKSFFEQLGVEVVMCPKVTPEIIKPGVMQSSDSMCYPYKSVLGQQVWMLEHGATDLLMFNTCGECRFKHYYELQAHTLRQLGYQFKMRTLTMANFLPKLMGISDASFDDVIKAIIEMPLKMERIEDEVYSANHNSDLRIGIIGEFYTVVESDINFDIVRQLQKMGVAVHSSMLLSEFVGRAIHLDFFDKREEKKQSWKLLSQEIGGHGRHSIENTAYYGKLGFDGIIHLLPLTCLPESTVESLVDYVADKYGIPLYRFPIDESLFEVGVRTRLETFISMLKRRKK